jgi:hypothetical protein
VEKRDRRTEEKSGEGMIKEEQRRGNYSVKAIKGS